MEESAKSVMEPLAWIFQLISGLILTLLITVHFYLTHMTSHTALHYNEVVARISTPYYKFFYIVLLFFVSFHAFNGLRAIILDTNFGARNRNSVNAMCYTAFIFIFLYGTFLVIIL